MLRVRADHAHHAWRWITLHLSHIFLTDARTFMDLSFRQQLHNPAPRPVVRRKLHFHPVAQPQPHKIRHRAPAGCADYFLLPSRPNAERSALGSNSIDSLRPSFLLTSWPPSAPTLRLYGRVKTHGPFVGHRHQCSKCAEYDPSFVTAVHLSDSTLVSGLPAFTIGSIARTMPSFNRGFSFLRST